MLFELQHASKCYQRGAHKVQALRDFSLRLDAGEILGLLGPNGSGKTTFVKLATGLCDADAGELRWRGHPVSGHRHLRELGVLLEGRGAGYERLSTWENARYFCGLREARFDAAHFQALAELLELPDVRAPLRQLSTGNKLRASLLCTLIHKPALALLDEPTLGLDLLGVDKLEALVRHGAGQGMGFVISSHDLHFIERLCPRIVCISRGEKLYDGCKSEFLQDGTGYVLQLQAGPQGAPALPEGLGAWLPQGDLLQLPLRDHAQACAALACLQPQLPACLSMELRPVSLRDRYRKLVGEQDEEGQA
ncbi:ABC-2 type transport system ATP-binding protein [Paucibacter oligotrophus]|uniref:ABC-2 type transport system ATP-binding protein n=1 Tax=Roseateles oligotrophus TaxID=1769250 RepID=A0A840LB39_9BURK|nr:ABC transporter ATP-binding protein [Roseateles oligotrophus]MBB4842567.1 ABC-2 type transport system ATP-binding protein [Roseateles oligotrophus]